MIDYKKLTPNWFDYEVVSPGPEIEFVIVEGTAFITLKKKYWIDENHKTDITVRFFHILRDLEYYSDRNEQKFIIDPKNIYKEDEDDPYCCNVEETKDQHENHFRQIGFDISNITKFCDKEEFEVYAYCIDRWAPLWYLNSPEHYRK